MTEATPKKSDLKVRVLSAIVMVAVAGTALCLGGLTWTLFVAAIAFGVLWEWHALARGFVAKLAGQAAWTLGGAFYIGIAASTLAQLRQDTTLAFDHSVSVGFVSTALLLTSVVLVDVGAYFAGRTIGGPKIAPAISPSKTWAGLAGGIAGATVAFVAYLARFWEEPIVSALPRALVFGCVTAVLAQTGDFFESWMKRRAGVKDSSNIIPGHGGLLDRVDGLLAVAFVIGLWRLYLLVVL